MSKKIFALTSFLALTSCGGLYNDYDIEKDPIDRPGQLERKDYIKELLPRAAEKEVKVETKQPPLPNPADMVLTPPKPKLGINKTVSLSVTEDVPLKDVFIELARLADIDIEIDPTITGGVIFKAKNRPFDEVVERISSLAGLQYTVNNGVLRIERDKPYVENYSLDFLNIVRSSSGGVSVNTAVLSSSSTSGGDSEGGDSGSSSGSSSSSSGGSGGLTSGSNAAITSQYDGDIWLSVQAAISAIIGTSAQQGVAQPGQTLTTDQPPFVSINRQASIVTVRTNSAGHARVKEYLQKVRDYASAQVLIEAKVVEVLLDDQFKSGINWADINIGDKINLSLANTAIQSSSTSPLDTAATIGIVNGDIDVALQLAESFGTTRTLSSPRILVLNNQQAILSFATNFVYFKIEIDEDSATGTSGGTPSTTSNRTFSSSAQTVPIGIILALQPSVNTKTNEIMMNIRPTLSRLAGEGKEDPLVAIENAKAKAADPTAPTISSIYPEVEVREMDSMLRVRSGEVMAIGGMIEQRISNVDNGVPYASELPVVGNLFKGTDKQTRSVQTVIFLKATIVPSFGTDKYDQNFYNKFNNDPRPIEF